MGHKMYNNKVQASNEKIPQYEVLQSCRKNGRPLQHYFINSATKKYYTSDLGVTCASKDRSISDLSTIQAPLKNPLVVFSKTPSTSCRYEV